MRRELVALLRCPATGVALEIEEDHSGDRSGDDVYDGWLVTSDLKHKYPIREGIPRFVPEKNYADNFGMQWNHFAKTQLDSFSGHPISSERFWGATGWKHSALKDQWVLDVGCGSGRFAEIALNAGAKVIALDYSSAVDACYANLGENPNLHIIQGDVYSLPLAPGSLSFVYSLGVLQHTPDVGKAFASLPPLLTEGGELCADFYWNRFRTMMNAKYLLRPFTKRIEQEKLFAWLTANVPMLLRASQLVGGIPIVGKILQRLIPVVNYTGVYPLSKSQLEEWALLDTFDMLAPAYDNPQSVSTLKSWFTSSGLEDVEVFHWGHLVGRGKLRKRISE